jgi:hypothetical protein
LQASGVPGTHDVRPGQVKGAVPGPQVPAPSQKVWVSVDESAQAVAHTVDESTLVHVPSLPETAQLWHVGQALTPQQKPSVQWPFVHWLSPVQVWPSARVGWQLPPGPVQ